MLLLLSAFFSGAETALMSLSKVRIRHLVDQKAPAAQTIANIVSQPDKLLSTLLIGNNLINIAASSVATALFIRWFGVNGVLIATGVMTVLVLIFGEITPKTLAAHRPEQVASRAAGPIAALMRVLSPFAAVFSFISSLILRLIGFKADEKEKLVTEEELRTFVDIGEEEGILDSEERAMIVGIFEFGDTEVGELMVPRADIVALPMAMTAGEAVQRLATCPFSRIPVYEKSVDHIAGIIHVKDLLQVIAEGKRDVTLGDIMRPTLFVPEGKKADELFADLRKAKSHMAIVLNEYGETEGLITMEDLIEEILGDISDEYDVVQPEYDIVDPQTAIVAGSASVSDINESLNLSLPDEEADTVAGIVFNRLGRLPKAGESVQVDGLTLEVAELMGRRISKVKITWAQPEPSPVPEPEPEPQVEG
ncbi:MAG TPA: hemolysin family protein [Sphingobacteriaceae bacterium]|nr:hemolysin family protein [Sphingobacteriaceae bacterium]